MDQAGILREYEGAQFGDRRLDRRLLKLAELVARDSEQSFPRLMSEAELEAAYRFFGNEKVVPDELLKAHRDATLERAKGHDCVVAHDTTTFSFRAGGSRRGLGTGTKGSQVLHGHVSLVADGSHNALGVVGFRTFATTRATEEQERWCEQVLSVAEAMGTKRVVHVMDREADVYSLYCRLKEEGVRFVVRAQHDRRITTENGDSKLRKALSSHSIASRKVWLGHRSNLGKSNKNRRIHPPREEREALLDFSASTVTLKRPLPTETSFPEVTTLNVVRAWEQEPPEGEEGVEWILFTTEPVTTPESILKVVDFYCNRWVVEEFFRALKSGCSIEERQLESAHSLTNAIALLLPIAWSLLNLRTAFREYPDEPASRILTPQEMTILRACSKKPLPKNPTIRETILAIARLGGHLPRNGPPGWITLGRGYEELRTLQRGFLLAHVGSREM